MAKREARLVPWGALNQAIEDHLATLSVDSFLDVTLTAEATGHTLYYNGTAWVNTNELSRRTDAQYDLSASGASANPGLWFVDSGSNDLGVIFYNESANELTLQGREAGATINLQSRNAGNTAYNSVLDADPDGSVLLYYAGTETFRTLADGIRVTPTGSNGTIDVLDGSSNKGSIYKVDSNGHFIMRNEENSGLVELEGRQTAGSLVNLLSADPNGILYLYYSGVVHSWTNTTGLAVARTSSTAPVLSFYDSNLSTRRGYLQFTAGSDIAVIRNEVVSGPLYIQATDSGSTVRTFLAMDPDGGVTINYSGGGLVCGAPTGGNKGTGTINATAVYDDNTLLTDYVFDAHLDGRIDFQKWDAMVPNGTRRTKDVEIDPDTGEVVPAIDEEVVRAHEPARRFDQADLDPKTYSQKWQSRRRLPAFDSPTGQPEQLPVGSWAQRLLETCEVQAIHIESLRQRIEALETGAANGSGPVGPTNGP